MTYTTMAARRAIAIDFPDPHVIETAMQETWGHMAPKVREIYSGHVLFTKGIYAGDYCIIDFELRLADGTELDGGPWFYTDIHDQVLAWINAKGNRDGGIWRFDGTFERFKNGKSRWRGKVRPMRVEPRFRATTKKEASE